MKGSILLIACLFAVVLMVEGKPVAKKEEEATNEKEPDTTKYKLKEGMSEGDSDQEEVASSGSGSGDGKYVNGG